MTGRSDISQEAAAWVVRLSDGEAGESEWLAFLAWLDEAPVGEAKLRRAAFDHAQAVWLALEDLELPRATVAELAVPGAPRRTAYPRRGDRNRPLHFGVWAGLAAASLLATIGVWTGSNLGRVPPGRRTAAAFAYGTTIGQIRTIHLSDGSRIDMDGASALRLTQSAGARQVVLSQGEASFDVVHDPRRPFTVDVGAAQVRVIGTAFDIERQGTGAKVAVARGAVSLQTGRQVLRVPAGTVAKLEPDGTVRSAPIAKAEVGDWRHGRRLFVDAPLALVVADLNRRYARPIRIVGDHTAQIRFTGVLVLGPQDRTLHRLTSLLPIYARATDDGEVVVGSRRS